MNKDIEIFENNFVFRGKAYKYEDVKNLFKEYKKDRGFSYSNPNTVPLSYEIRITLDNEEVLNLIYKQSLFSNKKNIEKIRYLSMAFMSLGDKTYFIRKEKYLKTLKINNFFSVGECKLFPYEKKIIFRDKEYNLEECKFYEMGSSIEVWKVEEYLNRKKRKININKIPQISKKTDYDIIDWLLSEYFGKILISSY